MKRNMQTIPFKKVAFSETPYKRDFKKFAAYTIVIVQAIRMKACASNLIKHSDSIKYCDDKYITYIRKSGGEHTFQDLIDVIDEYRELK